jgi:hypothetical protein
MSPTEKIAFKNRLKAFGLDLIAHRISTAQVAMAQAQEAANSEEKSSAGDKYETGRAMGHLQKEMHTRQLAAWLKERAALETLATASICKEGRAGAILRCTDDFHSTDPSRSAGPSPYPDIYLFISAGLGRQTFDDRDFLFLSPLAPLAKTLLGKKPGDGIEFNKSTWKILEIF